MGQYLNPGTEAFQTSINSQIYIDKSLLIEKINRVICTEQKYICVSRPRRFGKSMAANMLAAYYGASREAKLLFAPLKISKEASYTKHLGNYDVIKINMQEFLSTSVNIEEMLAALQKRVLKDLHKVYSEYIHEDSLIWAMADIYAATKRPFVILIDEWDCLFREYSHNLTAQKKYLDFLRSWLKDQPYVALAYMTGILPIKKYGTHSALNMFNEYSMTDPGPLAPYFGFTEDEVQDLCALYNMDFYNVQAWYDGYTLRAYAGEQNCVYSMYSPKSVVEAMLRHKLGTYWNQTETYEALKAYIAMDIADLKKAVITMLAGGQVAVNIGTFANDMTSFQGRDDVLTLLVHLGYLSYDEEKGTVRIPNKEVAQEYFNAVSTMSWGRLAEALKDSKELLHALWRKDADAVALGIERAHEEISLLEYNDENSLSCTIGLAFYYAREYYTMIRELPTGKGFADICFLPRKGQGDKPAVIIELKYNQSARGAIDQIKQKKYTSALEDYCGRLLLVGVNYDKRTKSHSCIIEEVEK